MAALINRVPTGRLISLLAELQYIRKKFGGNTFTLNDMKYDAESSVTQLDFFPLAINHPKFGKRDPYLRNILSKAGFHLTQSKQYDSQKSKSVSECMNALEGLGWAERATDDLNRLTKFGMRVSELNYNDETLFKLLRKSVLAYGPFVGFLYKCLLQADENNLVGRSCIKVGYINTREKITLAGAQISLSTGSQKDSITRTRSSLFAWAITCGFAWPQDFNNKIPKNTTRWHIDALELIKLKNWPWKNFLVFIPEKIFDGNHTVAQPLTYKWMTKSTKALRERGQKEVREATLNLEKTIANRRFAIVYSLALTAEKRLKLNYKQFISQLKRNKRYVVDSKRFEHVMEQELDIAFTAGIPFSREKDVLTPHTKLDLRVLAEDVDEATLEEVKKIAFSSTTK